jgi:hypothetical protein
MAAVGRGRSLEVKKDGVPLLARKQSFLSLSSRRHQRVPRPIAEISVKKEKGRHCDGPEL